MYLIFYKPGATIGLMGGVYAPSLPIFLFRLCLAWLWFFESDYNFNALYCVVFVNRFFQVLQGFCYVINSNRSFLFTHKVLFPCCDYIVSYCLQYVNTFLQYYICYSLSYSYYYDMSYLCNAAHIFIINKYFLKDIVS